MRFFTKLNDVTPRTSSNANSTSATASAPSVAPLICSTLWETCGTYDIRYTAMCPSERIHAMIDSSARMGSKYVFAFDPWANTPTYITTTNRASESVHLWMRRRSALDTTLGNGTNALQMNSTSSRTAMP